METVGKVAEKIGLDQTIVKELNEGKGFIESRLAEIGKRALCDNASTGISTELEKKNE